jgi:hypothetical protein
VQAQHVVGAEAGVDVEQRAQAAQQQAGPRQQRDREGDLGHDQQPARTRLARAAHGGAAGRAQLQAGARAPRLHRGEERCKAAREREQRQRAREHWDAQRDLVGARQAGASRGKQGRERERCARDAQGAPEREDRRDLGDRLQGEPPARRAERQADRQLAAAAVAARRQQVREVQARDRQQAEAAASSA